MKLFEGDCLVEMTKIPDKSIDIVIADLPYGRLRNLDWDKTIDLDKMWAQLNRICKKTTPICLFADFKFAMQLMNSNPKNFKYEIVWDKQRTTTPLLSRRRMGKATEYVLIFYKKQCCYNFAKYHKVKVVRNKTNAKQKNEIMSHYSNSKHNEYEPRLPINIVSDHQASLLHTKKGRGKETRYVPTLPTNVVSSAMIIGSKIKMKHSKTGIYEPRLPTNVIQGSNARKNKTIRNITEKPQFLLEHLLKYFSNENDTCLDFVMGSGSCGVACHRLKRKFIGIEMKPEHFKLAKERLDKLEMVDIVAPPPTRIFH